mgnify:CR=1 FL=1|jgi:hypothetical protein
MEPSNKNLIDYEEISIVVHVDEDLDEQIKKRVEHQLLKLDGVQAVVFDKFRPHLLFVRYSPSLVEVYKIIGKLRSFNLHVQLIVGN